MTLKYLNVKLRVCTNTANYNNNPAIKPTMNLVDLRVLRQDFIGQFLGRGENLGVVHRDQVLNELLQLISVHLE